MVWSKLVLEDQIHTKEFEILEKSDNYDILIEDLGKCIIFIGVSDKIFTLPDVNISYIGFRIRFSVSSLSSLTINPYIGGTINGLQNLRSTHQYALVELTLIAANTWIISKNSAKYTEYNYGSWRILPNPVTGYLYNKEIRILKENISGTADFINFPMVFNSIHNDFRTVVNGGYVTNDNGYDIIFTDSDGVTQLDHEIERYNSSTGEFVAHVKIPTLHYDQNTIIYIQYGNDSIETSQENVADVWDNNYIGVYHLDSDVLDSTTYANNGVDQGTGDIDGKIGHGRTFSEDYIQLDSILNDFDGIVGTISMWLTLDSVVEDQQLFQFYADDTNQIYASYNNSGNSLRVGRKVGVAVSSSWSIVAPYLSPQNYISCIVELNGEIYGSGFQSSGTDGGQLYKWNGLDTWVEVAPKYGTQSEVKRLVVFNGKIYGSTEHTGDGGCLLEWNGLDAWVLKASCFSSQTSIQALIVFNGKIYAGTYPSGLLLEWNGVNAWVQKASQLNSQYIISLCEYNEKLYAGTGGTGRLFEWNGVDTWVQKASQYGTEYYANDLKVFNGKLYNGSAGTGLLLEWNDVDSWVLKASRFGSVTSVILCVYNEKLYGGSSGGYLLEWNGLDTWVEKANSSESFILWMIVFNNKIYAGSADNGRLLEWNGVDSSVDKYIDIDGIVEGSFIFKKLTLTWSEVDDELKVFVNGDQVGTTQTSIGVFLGSINASINLGATYNELLSWDGNLDELRVSKVVRSADLEETEFNNQDSPSDFYILS
jgi:hypothetical protein